MEFSTHLNNPFILLRLTSISFEMIHTQDSGLSSLMNVFLII